MESLYDYPFYSPSSETFDYYPHHGNYYSTPALRPAYQFPPSLHPAYQPLTRKPTLSRRTTPETTSSRSCSHPREVVSIPVNFIGSGAKNPSRADYAVQIQKVFRGFRIRKNVKKILQLKREIDGVERKLLEGDTVELIKRDEREKLKVNETLMALLFKLDSVRGIDDAVRICRKAVIRKAIMLQEKVDSLASVVDVEETLGIDEGGETRAIDDDGGKTLDIDEEGGETLEHEIGVDDSTTMQVEEDAVVEELKSTAGVERENLGDYCDNVDEIAEEITGKLSESNDNAGETAEETLGNLPEVDDEMQVENHPPKDVDAYVETEAWECVDEEDENVEFVDVGEGPTERPEESGNSMKKQLNEEWFVIEESKKSKKLLEKMVEDNQKLMEMVADLCQKNANQTRLITSLTHRVEQLEQAMSDRLRRKKEKKKKISANKQ